MVSRYTKLQLGSMAQHRVTRNFTFLDDKDKKDLRHYEKKLKKGECERDKFFKENPDHVKMIVNAGHKINPCGICSDGKNLYHKGKRIPKYITKNGKKKRIS